MSSDVPNTNAELFQRWGKLMAGAGMTVRDVGNGMVEMVPEIEYIDEMTDTDREWNLQVPDKDVTWTVNLGDGTTDFSESCMLAPTLSKGWYEMLSRRNLAIPIEKDKKLNVHVYGSWNTTKGEPRTQIIARGWFSVPGRQRGARHLVSTRR